MCSPDTITLKLSVASNDGMTGCYLKNIERPYSSKHLECKARVNFIKLKLRLVTGLTN